MTNATPVELYVSEDRSIYRINRLRENGQFFTFERLTGEGINELIDLSQNNKRSQKNTRLRGTTTRQQQQRQEPLPRMQFLEVITFTNVPAV